MRPNFRHKAEKLRIPGDSLPESGFIYKIIHRVRGLLSS